MLWRFLLSLKKLTAPPVKEKALENNIPVFQPESLRDQTSLIEGFGADVMVVVAYGMLLPQTILDIPPYGCINIHASLLPRWRGAAPIQRAIEAGDAQTGVSIMQMEAGLDTGPVFEVFSLDITKRDTSSSMHDKLAILGAQGICSTLTKLQNDPTFKAITQNESAANYAKKISKLEAQIDWSLTADEIDARIRAFNPWPICQTLHNKNRIRIWQACETQVADSGIASDLPQSPQSGQILQLSEDGIVVACGSGSILLEKLQKDGSKAMAAQEFLNGYTINVGDKLSSAK